MGPEGGINGGQIICEGTPEKISENKSSYTGTFLKPMLKKNYKKNCLVFFNLMIL
jgi:excinuclease ABC subunit A